MSGFALKLIAIFSMFIDHMGAGIFTEYRFLRVVGRLAFPIFCFLLVEGFHHTRNPYKYLRRLVLFGILSEVPFDLLLYGKVLEFGHQNVFFTLALGLFMLILMSCEWDILVQGLTAVSISLVAEALNTDYRYYGILLILFFEVYRNCPFMRTLSTSKILFWCGRIESAASFSHIPIILYNGKRGPDMRWFFYFFYPGHFIFLYMVKRIFFKG